MSSEQQHDRRCIGGALKLLVQCWLHGQSNERKLHRYARAPSGIGQHPALGRAMRGCADVRRTCADPGHSLVCARTYYSMPDEHVQERHGERSVCGLPAKLGHRRDSQHLLCPVRLQQRLRRPHRRRVCRSVPHHACTLLWPTYDPGPRTAPAPGLSPLDLYALAVRAQQCRHRARC